MNKIWIYVIATVAVFLLGLFSGYEVYGKQKLIQPTNKETIYVHDTSVVFKVSNDTSVKKLVKVKGTTVISTGGFTIHDSGLIRIDTVRHNDTIIITKTIKDDTISVTLEILKDDKDGSIRIQAKTDKGKIVNAIQVPESMYPTVRTLDNSLGLQGAFAPLDGVFTIGAWYDRDIGPFVIGALVTDQVNRWENVGVGIKAGVRF